LRQILLGIEILRKRRRSPAMAFWILTQPQMESHPSFVKGCAVVFGIRWYLTAQDVCQLQAQQHLRMASTCRTGTS